MEIALIIGFAAYALLLWRDFHYALRFFPLLLPTYLIRFSLGPLPTTALEIFFLLLFFAWGVKRWKTIPGLLHKLVKIPLIWPLLLLLIGATLSIFFAVDIRAALGIWKAYFIEPALLGVILYSELRTPSAWKQMMISLGGVSIFLTVIAIIQSITGWWSPTWEWTLPESRRVTSLFTSPNALGLFVGPVTLFYLGWLWLDAKSKQVQPRLRFYQVIVILSGLLSVYLAVSRGAMIAMAAAFVVFLWHAWSKKGTAILFSCALIGALLLPSVRAPLATIASFQVDSGQSRLVLYTGTIQLLRQTPMQGLGLASFAARFEEVREGEFTEN